MGTNRPGKDAPRRIPSKRAGEALGYVALHGTDLSLCIAGGFLSARKDQPASRDQHLQPGSLMMAMQLPVPASHVSEARGAIEYGSVAIIEIELGAATVHKSAAAQEARLELPLPLAYVRRVFFRTDAERKEFVARSGAYGDIPKDILTLKVEPDAFPPTNQTSLTLPVAGGGTPGEALDAKPYVFDKIGGALAALLSTMRIQPTAAAAAVLNRLATGESTLASPGGIAGVVAALLDPEPEANQHGNVALARTAASVLGAMRPDGGFDPVAFLGAIGGGHPGASAAQISSVESFSRHATDIVEMRREVSRDAFSDAPGKIAPRALLLFILNPDPDRLLAIPKRVPNLGPSVFLLASIFAGSFAGLANLPASLKAPDKGAFLGVGLLAFNALRGQASTLEVKKEWDAGGNGRIDFALMGRTLLTQKSDPPAGLMKAFELFGRLGLAPAFDAETGGLSMATGRGVDRRMATRLAQSPTFPRVEALEIAVEIELPGTKKSVASLVANVLENAGGSGIFARVVPGNGKRAGLSVYCPARDVTEASLAEAIRVLVAQADAVTLAPS